MPYIIITIVVSVVAVILILIRVYFRLICARCRSKVTLLGKTALVTGASSGIGYQIATELASRGCRVVLAQRTTDEVMKAELIKETKNPNIILEYVDMSSFESVRNLVGRMNASLDKLDILINNAGVGNSLDALTKDGFTFLWQINYYSPFLLTYLLVDLLKKSDSGRIIFTGSILAHLHTVSARDIENNRIKSKIKVFDYVNTKFLTILAADFFAMKLMKFNITSNSYHPGIVSTPIFEKTAQHYRGIMDRLALIFALILKMFSKKTVEEGAQTALHLAIANEVANVTGEFYGENTKSCKPHGAHNEMLRERVWKATEFSVGLKPEEILE
ncbi:unnamed protein product [Phaedon cochleariae]|uniref:Uncharacterized protein n=1 Tax=Phaedon cochleariae TaxID=80249 RepID=A0A9P0GST3_PHACE|nr:unnamed protein product [Phaedon cochleariae]